MNSAPAPAANGEPETEVRNPELLTANTETLPEPELLTNAKLVVGPGMPGGVERVDPQPLRKMKTNVTTKEGNQ